MTDLNSSFNLRFEHNGEHHDLKTRFVRLGYIHQFHVCMEEKVFIIEFDEERQYRIIDASQSGLSMEKSLLEAIVNQVSLLHQN
jgi:hypothetical protein